METPDFLSQISSLLSECPPPPPPPPGATSGTSAPPPSKGGKASGGGGPTLSSADAGHASRLWQFLDELAERDPEEYSKFIESQALAAGVEGGGVAAAKKMAERASARRGEEEGDVVARGMEELRKGKAKASGKAGGGSRGDDGKMMEDILKSMRGEERGDDGTSRGGKQPDTSSSEATGRKSVMRAKGGALITEVTRRPQYEVVWNEQEECYVVTVSTHERIERGAHVSADVRDGGISVEVEGYEKLFVFLDKVTEASTAVAKLERKKGKIVFSITV